ncbi:hypothetical protein N7448_010638 [Penicillium atrosanguineum]|nr:hypothetical protein N7448_010638 [Penicillium atrosanguineum]
MPPFDMNHGFNYPESSESSEQCYDQSHHAQTASSVTSYTPMNLYRVDYLPYDMMSSTGPVDPQDTMLQGITGGGSSINTAMLANLGSKNMEEDLSAASNSLGRNDETSALIGLTRAEARVSQPPTGDPGPGQTLREFNIDYSRATANHEQQMGGPPQGVPNFIDPTVTLLNQGHQAQPSPNQAMQGQYPSGTTYFRVPDYNPNGGMGPGFDGQQRNYRTMPVLGLDEPVFSESEMVWPSALDIKTTSLSGSLLKMLPMIDLDPFKKWLCKPLQGLGSLALSGLDFVTQFDPPSSKIAMVNPDCQCKCACRAKARAELASGRKVEMKFKLRPVYRGTSHLRSRVEIVVKLLKLRSSVTESKAKREEAKSAIAQAFEPTLGDRAEEITNYDSDVSDESDAESVFDEDEDDTDALSTSSSYADLQTLVSTKSSSSTSPVDSSDNSLLHFSDGESEENNDGDILIEFNFDLGAALSKLEKWTGGSSMDMFSDMCTSDPGRLFEYLTAYILYVIMSLAHSQDHGSLRRLDN